MTEPIKIERYKDCVPKNGIWYDHWGTIFISVMRKSKPYVRRKAVPYDKKMDNDLSEWHREWQYDKIELNYGSEQFGVKSYEVTINIDNEDHRIDSLVKGIAIEFQHTLSVGLDEIDLRFSAHSKYGLIPYLVIDLADYSTDEFKKTFISEEKQPLKTKLNKWLTSKYSESNNLFIDLKDGMIRIVNSVELGYLEMSCEYFLKNLLELEKYLVVEIKQDQERVKKERKERLKREKESELRSVEKERERFYHEKFDNPDFKFYRFCFANPVIKPYVMPFNGERFEYFTHSDEVEGYLKKWHRYYSKDSNFEILYRTVSKIIEKKISTYKGIRIKKEFEYLFAEIQLKDRYITIAKFERKGKFVKIIPKEKSIFRK
jgi:hypothetical protein